MMSRRHFLTIAAGASTLGLLLQRVFNPVAQAETAIMPAAPGSPSIAKITRTDAEWRKLLTPAQYHVLRESGTELAGSGKLLNNHETGVYLCAGCDFDLFRSDAKFESGTGWPSFFQPVAANHVTLITDSTFFMRRTETRCARCDSHLGHVFDDGPAPTGQRFCMNSVALKFRKA